MAVKQNQPGFLLLSAISRPEKVLVCKRDVSMHLALVGLWQDHISDKSRRACRARALAVESEAKILLAVGARQVRDESVMSGRGQSDTTRHWEA
jgi:hypothetical protein